MEIKDLIEALSKLSPEEQAKLKDSLGIAKKQTTQNQKQMRLTTLRK